MASIKLLLKFEYQFSPTNYNQNGRQNGRRLSICFCAQSTIIILFPITSKFHIWITFIKLSLCPITKMAAKMAATYQFTLADNLVIYHPISSKFHIWTSFIKLLFISKYGFCPTHDYQYFRQNGYPFFAAGHKAGPFVGVQLF